MTLPHGILLGHAPTCEPQRIVSLVPSQTELCYHLGLGERVAGITRFCVHPEHWFRTKTRVGGTKQVNMKALSGLQPDLILANKEENVAAQIDEMLGKGIPVYVSDVKTMDDALNMIRSVGLLTNRSESAAMLANAIHEGFSILPATPCKRFAYFVWRKPWMVAGGDTFISHLLQTLGWKNVFANEARYPVIQFNNNLLAQADVILLASEPFPFKAKHIIELPLTLQSRSYLIDGEMMSWYGSRLLQVPAYWQQFLQQFDA